MQGPAMIAVLLELVDINKFPGPFSVTVFARLKPKVTTDRKTFRTDDFSEPSGIQQFYANTSVIDSFLIYNRFVYL